MGQRLSLNLASCRILSLAWACAVFIASTALFPLSAEATLRPPIVGEVLPEASLRKADGGPSDLAALATDSGGKPSVVVFVDARTCFETGCLLGQLDDVVPHLEKIGYRMVYVFGGSAEAMRRFQHQQADGRTVVADPGFHAARKMGLLSTSPGRNERIALQTIPSVFVVGTDGLIRYEYVSISESIPLSGEVLLTAARVYRDAIVMTEKAE